MNRELTAAERIELKKAGINKGFRQPKTAKVSSIVRVYSLTCPYCNGDVANDSADGSLDFYDSEQNGRTGTCTVCDAKVKLPKPVRSGDGIGIEAAIKGQRAFIAEHGGTLEGYRKYYALASGSHDVAAIYAADIQRLRDLEGRR